MAKMENRLLSVDEEGKYLCDSNDNVYRWIDKLTIPAQNNARFWEFKKTEVDEWVKAGHTEVKDKKHNTGDER